MRGNTDCGCSTGDKVLRAEGDGEERVDGEVLQDDRVRGEGERLRSQRELTELLRLQPPWRRKKKNYFFNLSLADHSRYIYKSDLLWIFQSYKKFKL